ncbi:hypothetical protein [Bounagaea algeriensis]
MTGDGARDASGSHGSEVDESGVADDLPTALYSVVWSHGHAYVLERLSGARWAGVDDRGRPCFLTDADLRRRGFTVQRARAA